MIVQGGVNHGCVWRRVNPSLTLCCFMKLIPGAAVWGGGKQGAARFPRDGCGHKAGRAT